MGPARRDQPAPYARSGRRSPPPGRLPRPRGVHPDAGERPSRPRGRPPAAALRAAARAGPRRRPSGDPPPQLPGGGHASVPRGGSRAPPATGHRRAGRRNRCRRHHARRPKNQTWTKAPTAHLFDRWKEAPPGGSQLAGEGGSRSRRLADALARVAAKERNLAGVRARHADSIERRVGQINAKSAWMQKSVPAKAT